MDGKQAAGAIAALEDFEAVFREHFAPVYRFIARRVGKALAEDLAAEVFATAYRRRAAYQPGRGSLRSWLYGIAANLVRNHWRAEQHLLALDARLVPEVDLSGSAEAVDQRVTAAMLAPTLAAGLARLTRDQRDVLLLHAWAELSHEEIAAVRRGAGHRAIPAVAGPCGTARAPRRLRLRPLDVRGAARRPGA